MSDWVELVERGERAEALRLARERALRLLAPDDPRRRSWLIHKNQWRRFIAAVDPLEQYPDETAQFVETQYDRIRGRGAYLREVGLVHRWSPPEHWWQRHPYAG